MPPAPTLTAKTRTTCSMCHITMEPGGEIYALEGVPGLLHPECAREHCKTLGRPFVPPVCKHLLKRGYCLFNDSCFYQHPPDIQPSLQEKKIKLRKGAGKPSKQIQTRNRFRAATFRRFLLKVFGRDLLAQGSGVLDVAGGTGELSFEFLNLNRISSTVIEPRPCLSLERQCRWLEAGFYFRNPVFQEWVDASWSEVKGCPHFPGHQRMLLDADVTSCLASRVQPTAMHAQVPASSSRAASLDAQSSQHAHCCQSSVDVRPDIQLDHLQLDDDPTAPHQVEHSTAAACNRQAESPARDCCSASGDSESETPTQMTAAELIQQAHDNAAAIRWTQKGLATGGHESSAACPGADREAAECDCGHEIGEVRCAPAPRLTRQQISNIHQCWQDASVIVGMHPDQATEHLVQFAMQTRKPFATVPCCVFPNDFPGRRLNGAPVRKYDDFISYLVSLAPEHIQVEELMFEGRNKVVYCTSWESDPRPAAACAH